MWRPGIHCGDSSCVDICLSYSPCKAISNRGLPGIGVQPAAGDVIGAPWRLCLLDHSRTGHLWLRGFARPALIPLSDEFLPGQASSRTAADGLSGISEMSLFEGVVSAPTAEMASDMA